MGVISIFVLLGMGAVFFYVMIVIFFAILVSMIITYTFESIALMRMSKNLGYKGVATAWIPFYNKYILGKIAKNQALGIILAIIDVSILISGICYEKLSSCQEIFLIIFLVCVCISFIINAILSHKVYERFCDKRSDMYTVLGIITFGFLRPIFLFSMRNKEEEKEV